MGNNASNEIYVWIEVIMFVIFNGLLLVLIVCLLWRTCRARKEDVLRSTYGMCRHWFDCEDIPTLKEA